MPGTTKNPTELVTIVRARAKKEKTELTIFRPGFSTLPSGRTAQAKLLFDGEISITITTTVVSIGRRCPASAHDVVPIASLWETPSDL